MVKNCPKCGEYAYATRFKDSYMSFCRECAYYNIAMGGEGFLDDEEFEDLKERFPIKGVK